MHSDFKDSAFAKWVTSQLRKLYLFPRMFLVFCTCLLLSTLIITLVSQTTYSSEIESNKIRELSAFSQSAMLALKQEVSYFENSMEPFIRSGATLEKLEHLSGGETSQRAFVRGTLQQMTTDTPGVRAMIYVDQGADPESVETVSTVHIPDVAKLLDSELYTGAVAAAGYPFWRDSTKDTSELFYDTPQSVLGIAGCVTLSYQLYTPKTRQPLGVLICCISPSYFVQALTKYTFQPGTNTFLIGSNGMIEGIGAEFSAPPFPALSETLLHFLMSQESGSRQMTGKNGEMLMTFCGDGDIPIRVVNLTYRDYVMAPIYRLRELNVAVMVVVIALGALCCYLVAISIAHPVQRLVHTMKRVGAGHFEEIYKPESHDEIGILCSEFDKMVKDMLSLLDRMYLAETRQSELELAQKTAQLDALQMQVNPHFLYNTLDIIRWECMYENGGESPASDMIERFCTLLRMTIKGDRQKETIQDSLLHAKTYLEVVNFRHSQKIQLETEFPFDCGQYWIPCLSLQPILENAVRHGFSGESCGNRLIQITGWLEKDQITITVADNGCGMTPDQLEALKSKLESSTGERDHMGLRNVNQRCRLCYGENYGIQIDSKLSVGTMVVLTIPAEQVETETLGGENHVSSPSGR